MRTISFIYYSWIAFVFPCFGIAQKSDYFLLDDSYVVEQITVEQGLSDNVVNSILQDHRGFLWFGTNDGLNRYDGYTYKTFKHESVDSTSLSHNLVNYLLEDRKGRLWVATDGGLNLFDPSTESFQCFTYNPNNSKGISHNQVRTLFEDEDGILWVGTFNGLNKFDPETQEFTLFQNKTDLDHTKNWTISSRQEVSAIEAVNQNRLIVGFWGSGIFHFDKLAGTFSSMPVQEEGVFDYATVDRISPVKDGHAWVVMRGYPFRYTNGQGLQQASDLDERITKSLEGFESISSNRYLALSHNGAYIYDQNFEIKQHLLPQRTNPLIPWHNAVLTYLEDRAGDLWFGTMGSGIFRLSKQQKRFRNYVHQVNVENSLPKDYVTSLLEVAEDEFWVGTRRNGIRVFSKEGGTFSALAKHIEFPNGLNWQEIKALFKDSQGNIWIGTWGKGLIRYQPDKQKFQYYRYERGDSTTLHEDYVLCIYETAAQEIWVGTIHGVCVLRSQDDIESGNFKRRKPALPNPNENLYTVDIQESSDGNIWIGTGKGLYVFDQLMQEFVPFLTSGGIESPLNSSAISSIFKDSDHRLWFSTKEGVYVLDQESEQLTHFTKKDGLTDTHVTGILEDQAANIWITTKSGIAQYQPGTGVFKTYNNRDGFINRNVDQNAFVLSQDGETILCGGRNGLTTFRPAEMEGNSYLAPVHISSLKMLNHTLEHATEPLTISTTALDKIELSYRDNILTFQLNALNFRIPEKNQYAYRLEGFNENWIYIGTKREITFTNLDPGQYILMVKASNNDGVWNETVDRLGIVITPPWWKTWWAYVLYSSIFIAAMYIIFSFLRRRFILQNKLKQEQAEANRLKELDTFKSRLYTNLTHEFRTPLTVILGMVDQIRNQPKKYLTEGVELIERNGNNLLRLINQLLDLSKLEDKSFQLVLQQGDIVSYLRYITESFQTYANAHNLSLRFFSPIEKLMMDYDPEQIKQVLSNLISNAIKYTPAKGEVKVRLHQEQNHLLITIQDNGVGIAEQDLPYIFNRFYQIDNSLSRNGEGTGIGLAHAQELVRLMGGEIWAESKVGIGSNFKVRIPIRREAAIADQIQNPLQEVVVSLPSSTMSFFPSEAKLPQVLLIEDNPDVVIYLQACLANHYQVDIAYNGKIGIEKALTNIPDLIISDVMMPEKNGYEVCNTLKQDERTSHIPIILLTAKVDTESKIEGLRRGADAYLAKPFDKEELLVRLRVLMEKQQRLVAYFSKQFQTGFTQEKDQEESVLIEDEFIQKVRQIVEAHFTDEDFALPQLCQKIGMSRSQLFRKMKALINVSPSQFIRMHRLQSAKILLETTDLTVSEVAWQVGYKDLSHFSRSFQETFGEMPSSVAG